MVDQTRHEQMIGTATWLAEQGFGYIGWVELSDGKAPKRRWKADATDDPALVPGLLHGARNSIVIPKGRGLVIDVDVEIGWAELEAAGLPPTFRIDSPTLGHGHIYAWAPDDVDMSEIPGSFEHGEIRRSTETDRTSGMVLGPFAKRVDGVYLPHDDVRDIAVLPTSVVEYLQASSKKRNRLHADARGPDDPGWKIQHGRHDYYVSQGRLMRGHGISGEGLYEQLVDLDRRRGDPPLADEPGRGPEEIREIATWCDAEIEDDPPGTELVASGSGDEEPKRKTQGERIREAVDEAEVEFFHDSEFRAYATFEREDHRETWAVRSSGFRRYVSWLMYQKIGKAPRAADLADFLALVEGRAQFDGQMRQAHVRIAPTDDGLAIDLGDADWTAIEVDARGWRHVARPDVRFIRPRGMLPLPVPVRGGSVDLLRPFVNVADDDWRLMVGFLVMMFRPTGPFPVLGVHGEQGAAKSTLMRTLRRLVDPRETMDRAAPRSEHDLAIHAMHNRVIALDNLSSLPEWLSDALARLATGAGFSTRQLYSDSDEFSFSAARPVMLNGIGEVIQRSDLLDRAVLIDLAPIPDTERRLEADFWADFDEARPQILGALLDAVRGAIKRESIITMGSWPRMADFARWVTASEPSLDWEDGSFLKAYYANRGSAHELALDADPIAIAVRDLMGKTSEWEGRPTELLTRLAGIAGEEVTRRKDWPGAAHVLSTRLERLAPNLRAVGIDVERSRGGNNRTIRLSKLGDARTSEGGSGASRASPASSVSNGDVSSSDADDAGDAGSRASDNGFAGDASSFNGDVRQ